ncbi:hypothetical protein BC829DRAFT_378860 [Chytridium lagenaria]|nr:hypothetical protein BC829DRAFT_378860 [Chytridium lagenaria]
MEDAEGSDDRLIGTGVNDNYLDFLNVAIKRGRLFTAKGFEFCEILNEAKFDSLSVIISLGISLEKKSSIPIFVKVIDSKAREIANTLYGKHTYLDVKDLNRFACYAAADGSTNLAGSLPRTMLRRVNSKNYFNDILPAIIPSRSFMDRQDQKPFYKIAYVITISGNSTLDDGSAVFLLHVDLDSEDLFEEIRLYMMERQPERLNLLGVKNDKRDNVFISSKRYRLGRTNSQSLMVMLNTFWEFLDLANWEHLINLSVFDVPMRKTREIVRILGLPHNKDRNFVEILEENDLLANIYTQAKLPRLDSTEGGPSFYTPSELGFMLAPMRRWQTCRQIYGMILTREYIEYLRSSDEVAFLLAFFEHSTTPHDGFFCHAVSIKIGRSAKRFFTLVHDIVIRNTTMSDIESIGDGEDSGENDDPRFLFALNVDVRQDDGIRLVHWLRENHVEKHQVLWF